jgi:hypothetical protein
MCGCCSFQETMVLDANVKQNLDLEKKKSGVEFSKQQNGLHF